MSRLATLLPCRDMLLRRRDTWIAVGILIVLDAAMLVQTHAFRGLKSITFDETFYLSAALQTVYDGRIDPQLALKGTAPLPVLLTWLPVALRHGGENRPDRWTGMIEDRALAASARRNCTLCIGLPLVTVLFLWLWKRHGLAAGARRRAGRLLSVAARPHSYRRDRRVYRPVYAPIGCCSELGLFPPFCDANSGRLPRRWRRHIGQVLGTVPHAHRRRGAPYCPRPPPRRFEPRKANRFGRRTLGGFRCRLVGDLLGDTRFRLEYDPECGQLQRPAHARVVEAIRRLRDSLTAGGGHFSVSPQSPRPRHVPAGRGVHDRLVVLLSIRRGLQEHAG